MLKCLASVMLPALPKAVGKPAQDVKLHDMQVSISRDSMISVKYTQLIATTHMCISCNIWIDVIYKYISIIIMFTCPKYPKVQNTFQTGQTFGHQESLRIQLKQLEQRRLITKLVALYSIDTVDWTKTTKICAHKKATTQTNLHPHKATTPDSMDCSKSLAIQRCYTSDPQSNTHMLQLGPLLLLFDPVRLALPGLMLLLASHMKLCRSQPILCLRLFLHTIQSICTKKLSVAGNDIVHSRAIYIIIVNGLCILGLKGGKATVVVWPLHIEPSTRNVKTEADGVLDPSLRQWVKRLIQRCLHMMSAPSMSEIGGRYATACYSAPGTRRTKASLNHSGPMQFLDLPWLTLCTI